MEPFVSVTGIDFPNTAAFLTEIGTRTNRALPLDSWINSGRRDLRRICPWPERTTSSPSHHQALDWILQSPESALILKPKRAAVSVYLRASILEGEDGVRQGTNQAKPLQPLPRDGETLPALE